MDAFRFTAYIEGVVLRKRPYIRREWCVRVVKRPVRCVTQPDGRIRHWAPIEELDGRVLRVVTLADRCTIHNAFADRSFKLKIAYYPDTDSLYNDLSEAPSAESREVSPGLVIDYDANGNVTGIDIDHASSKINLRELELSKLPTTLQRMTA
jgi:uncharacterized protein YuzE